MDERLTNTILSVLSSCETQQAVFFQNKSCAQLDKEFCVYGTRALPCYEGSHLLLKVIVLHTCHTRRFTLIRIVTDVSEDHRRGQAAENYYSATEYQMTYEWNIY